MTQQSVSMEAVESFVRQLGHDWRNSLNCLDLHLSGLRNAGTSAEREGEIDTAHQLVQQTARQLARVSRRLSTCHPQMIAYPVSFFVEDLQDRLQKNLSANAARFDWDLQITGRKMEIDFEALASGVEEIFTNALNFNPPDATFPVEVRTSCTELQLTIGETKNENPKVQHWSLAPALHSSARGHYGLGLYHLRQVLAAHRGEVAFAWSPETRLLKTSIRLPLLAA